MSRMLALIAGLVGAIAFTAQPAAATEFEKYAIESASASLASTQAGAHADMAITVTLTEKASQPYAITRDLKFKLPPGPIGNPQAVTQCTVNELGITFEESHCPFSSQIGIAEVKVGAILNNTFREPLYNMVPPNSGNSVARFGFIAGEWPAFVNVTVNPIDYSIEATLEGSPSAAGLLRATSTIWGVPVSPIHDLDRLTPAEAFVKKGPAGGRSVNKDAAERPFLSNPTNCEPPQPLIATATSYQLPLAPSSVAVSFPQMGGCGKLAFEPRFTAVPTNPEAFAPTGLDTELVMPQNESPNGRATSALRSALVTQPQGFSINPAAGDGQAACSAEQIGFGESKPAACPDAAKVGSIEADVPALARPLHGSVYLRTPEPGHLFRLWLAADEQGVHLKLPAEVELDPVTGQIKTVVSGLASLGGLPQVPVADLKLHVFGGPRAPLATPGCGTYQTSYRFTPWSGTPPVEGQTPMQISSGCSKGGFSPGLVAGTLNTGAGEFSAFTMTLTRADGEPNPQTLAVHLPQGLLAKIAGVPLCSDAAAPSGACPAGSRIGSLTAAAGVGGAPLWIPQPGKAPTAVYLAGPYKGAPYSIVSVVPAQAGPFDLGTVVNRAGLFVDPETALATVRTDPLPQILEGVPVSYRTLHADVDRGKFTLNPTDCSRKTIRATVVAVDGRTAEPTSPFQATNCAKLAYKPKLKIAFQGATRRTGHPAVKAVLTQKPHQANTSAATVILPASEFIDQAHISNPCTRVQFNADACPNGSILGTVVAETPLLDKPLHGKVYFRSNGGQRELPDIVADLRGAIHITLVGFVDAVHKKGSETSRVRTRFLNVPDAPVTRFTMSLYGGKRGLLVNSRNLCQKKRRLSVELDAQNGRVKRTNPVIATACR